MSGIHSIFKSYIANLWHVQNVHATPNYKKTADAEGEVYIKSTPIRFWKKTHTSGACLTVKLRNKALQYPLFGSFIEKSLIG